ncbi:MAG: HD domain-containing protein [Deltaproteobacteria bacterium]|jgi:3'-5' exoribonuclease|nr:HD domain-containing protein [Deltaproteobacteria bacterium]
MAKDTFVSDLKKLPSGSLVSSTFMVSEVNRATTKQGSLYLSLTLSDRSGSIDGKIWETLPEHFDLVTNGSVLSFVGNLDSFKGNPQLKITSVKTAQMVDLNDYLKTAHRSTEVMKTELMGLVDSIQDHHFRVLVKAALDSPQTQDFFTFPAGKAFHHAYLGGLLEHTLQTAKLADLIAGLYPNDLNRDLLLSGAILHDIGKCWEFMSPPANDYTIKGRMMGHLTMGALFLSSLADDWPEVPNDKLLFLEHMLLSHHGTLEKGSSVTPKTLEALVLNYLDELDSKLNHVKNFINDEVLGHNWEATTYDKLQKSHYYKTPKWERPQESPHENPHENSHESPQQSQADPPLTFDFAQRDQPRPTIVKSLEQILSPPPSQPGPRPAWSEPAAPKAPQAPETLEPQGAGQSLESPGQDDGLDGPADEGPEAGPPQDLSAYDDLTVDDPGPRPEKSRNYFEYKLPENAEPYSEDHKPEEPSEYSEDHRPEEPSEYSEDHKPEDEFAQEAGYPEPEAGASQSSGPDLGTIRASSPSEQKPTREAEKSPGPYWSSAQYTASEDDADEPAQDLGLNESEKSGQAGQTKAVKERGQRGRPKKSAEAKEGESPTKSKAEPKIDPKHRLF